MFFTIEFAFPYSTFPSVSSYISSIEILFFAWAIISGILGIVFQNSLYSGVIAMLGGLIIVPLVSLFTQNSKPQDTESKFECYNAEITVSAKHSLKDK